jgi:hypothetical protein
MQPRFREGIAVVLQAMMLNVVSYACCANMAFWQACIVVDIATQAATPSWLFCASLI